MDHEPPAPFDTVGDEPVEARIVAWVLGEASAFEAAELERLCDERPELLGFRRRMRALHGLLTEAEASEADHTWKLPPEKRRLLDEICGEEKLVRLEPEVEQSIHRSARRAWLAIAACVILTVAVVKLVGPIDLMSPMKNAKRAEAASVQKQASAEDQMRALAKAVRDQEDKVEERRKVLATIVRTKGIIYKGQDSFYGQSGVDEDQSARGALQTYNELQTQKAQLESQINSLLKYDSDELTRYASGLDLPENVVRQIYPQYLNSKRELNELKIQGLSDNHPRVKAAVEDQTAMKRVLDEGVVDLRETLKNQLSMARDRLKNVEAMKNDSHEEAIKRGLDAQDYVDAKRDFETDQELLQKLKLKQIELGIQSKVQNESLAANESPQAQPASAPAPIAKPSSATAPAEMTMSLAKDEDGRKDALENKKRSELLSRAGTGTLGIETQKALPEMADASKIEAMPMKPDSTWSGSANGGALRSREAGDSKSTADRFAITDELAAGQPAPEQDKLKDSITAGLRSGDQAISRNSIDAILSNPNGRTAGELVIPGAAARPASKAKADKGASAAPMPTLAGKDSGLQNQIVDSDADAVGLVMGASGSKAFEGSVNFGAPIDGSAIGGGLSGSADSALDSPTKSEDANGVEKAIELRKGGKEDELRKMQELLAAEKSTNEEIRREMDSLGDPIRSNAALTYEHTENADNVRKNLYMAEGNFNLGKLDDSKKSYEEVLRADPYNVAARRGLERIAQTKSDYYRAAYDHTRAELLSQVDAAWELPVPSDKKSQPDPGAKGQSAQVEIIREFKYPTESEPPTLSNPLAGNTNADNLDLYSSAASSNYYDESAKAPNRNFDFQKKLQGDGKPFGMEIAGANTSNYNLSAGAGSSANEPQAPARPDQSAEGAKLFFETKSNFNAAPGSALSGEVAQADAGKKQEVLESDSSTYDFMGRDLNDLAQKERVRISDTVVQSDRLRSAARDDFAKGAYQDAYGKYERALNALPEAPMVKERRDLLKKSLGDASVALASSAAKDGKPEESRNWYSKALEWDPENAQVRQALVLDSVEEIAASETPYSTFSLNISDASFQLAKAALAKGERPDPASIKPEQFYNAVDYGDPAPSSNAPVASTIEQSAHPIIPGRNLVRVALRTASVGRSATQPLHLTLLVDQSGSMVREDRRAAMEQALKQLGGLLTKNDSVTIIGFSRTPRLLADGLSGDQAAKLGDIINQTASEGGTNLEEAMKLGAQKAGEHQLAGAQNRIVLFTDGAANLGNADPEKLAAQVTALRQKGIAFDVAGIGADGLNDQLLGELARHGNGRYYVVGNEKNDSFARQLAGAFRPAAENVKVQVNFNPQRVGKYKLIGFEKDRLKTEDFRNDSVDAAELAADEAGVAIYQVEPLAEGTGEIGEVSVRFHDVASGEMVERTWTIPHESSAAAFDRATPSMQLAGLSLLTAEKLKGGPMADAIDFKLLTEPVASVKQFYGGSAPVADLLRMIDALK